MRQAKGKKFSYKDIRPVYTIVFFEQSPVEFHEDEFLHTYIHRSEQQTDSGVKIELLQTFIFVPLDIFKQNLHNKGITNRLDAWLAFLCMDDPEWIIQICTQYPDFKVMYEQVYDMCQNVERVMEMFSKELLELDRNTVRYMMDEMQEDINRQQELLNRKIEELREQSAQLNTMDSKLQEQRKQLFQQNEQLNSQKLQLRQQNEQLNSQKLQLSQQNEQLTNAYTDKLTILRNIMSNFNLSVDAAMEAAGIPLESRDELKAALITN